MKHKNIFYTLIMTAFALFTLTACNGKDTRQDTDIQAADTEGMVNIDSLNEDELFECDTDANNVIVTASDAEPTPEPQATPATPKKQRNGNTASRGGKETLYISTYGANGKVWGHVTMNGNIGRGTIHDDDENTYAITVTRHGCELYGTDQNGRQYVFRL